MVSAYILLIFVFSVFFSLFWKKKHEYIANIGTFFNSLSILYFCVGLSIYSLLYSGTLDRELEIITGLSFIANISFNAGYYVYFRFNRVKNIDQSNVQFTNFSSNRILVVVLAVAISSYFYTIFEAGFFHFFQMTRTERFFLLYQYKYLVFFSSFINLIYVIYAVRFLYFEDRKYKKYFYFLFFYILFISLATISRNTLLLLLITPVIIYNMKGVISNRKVVIYGVFFLIVLLFFKGFLYEIILDSKLHQGVNYTELTNWIRISVDMIQNGAPSYDYFSYWVTLKGLFLPIVDNMQTLTGWYMFDTYSDAYENGNRVAFSGVIEGYIMGGKHYIVIHYFTVGFLLAYVAFNKRYLHIILSIMIAFVLLKLFRSESYAFFRFIAWYVLYPLLIIEFISYLLKSRRHT